MKANCTRAPVVGIDVEHVAACPRIERERTIELVARPRCRGGVDLVAHFEPRSNHRERALEDGGVPDATTEAADVRPPHARDTRDARVPTALLD